MSGTLVRVTTGGGAERRKPTILLLLLLLPSTTGSTTLAAACWSWTAASSSLLARLVEEDAAAGPASLLLPPLPLPLRLPPLPIPPRPKMEGMAPVCMWTRGKDRVNKVCREREHEPARSNLAGGGEEEEREFRSLSSRRPLAAVQGDVACFFRVCCLLLRACWEVVVSYMGIVCVCLYSKAWPDSHTTHTKSAWASGVVIDR